ASPRLRGEDRGDWQQHRLRPEAAAHANLLPIARAARWREGGRRRFRGALARIVAAGLALVYALAPAAAEPPKRIVSLNLCTDQLLVDLVAPQRIGALSRLAADPALSSISDRIAG